MVDDEIVCCMCGDVGFSEKLFRCNKCHHRFQHSYCSSTNYLYLAQIQECDWCQTEQQRKNTTTTTTTTTTTVLSSSNSKKPIIINRNNNSAAGCNSSSSSSSGEKIFKLQHQHHHQHEMKRSKPPSPRHATRRYKLLKDVMC